MLFRDINSKHAPDSTSYFLDSGVEVRQDMTADTLKLWADKLDDNFNYIKRWFGTGVLEGGLPDQDGTRGTLTFTIPIRGLISGKQVTYDSTNTYTFENPSVISHYIFYKPVSVFRTEPFPSPDHTVSHYDIVGDGTVNCWIEGSKVEFLPQGGNDSTIVDILREIPVPTDTTADRLFYLYLNENEDIQKSSVKLDSTHFLLLWLIQTNQIDTIESFRDLRNVIPKLRTDISGLNWRGRVNTVSDLPLAGNNNGDIILVMAGSAASDDRRFYVWNKDIPPGPFAYYYWHGLITGSITDKAFVDIRFLGYDGVLRGVLGANSATALGQFTGGRQIDFDYHDDDNVQWNVKINDTMDMNRQQIVNASNIDTTGNFRIVDGLIDIDGTAVIYGSVDATNVIFNGVVTTGALFAEHGRFKLGTTIGRISNLFVSEGDIIVDGTLKIDLTLSVSGLIDGVDVENHSARHEFGGADVVDATHLSGILASPHRCGWIRGEPISTTPATIDQYLRYQSGTWTPYTPDNLSFEEQMAAYFEGFDPEASGTVQRMRNYFLRISVFTDSDMWELEGTSVTRVEIAGDMYNGACFDGKYVYYTPWNTDTFLRYDTDEGFDEQNSWQKTSLGAAGLDVAKMFAGNPCFDGRYVYFAPYNSELFVRFDTQGRRIYRDKASLEDDYTFQNDANWSYMDMTRVLGETIAKLTKGTNAYKGCVFDGRYVYYVPCRSNTAVRFDTRIGIFSSGQEIELDGFGHKKWIGDDGQTHYLWETMDMTRVLGEFIADDEDSWEDGYFDGQYIYFGLNQSKKFVRFNTRHIWIGTSTFANKGQWLTGFNDTTSWDVVDIGTILGHTPDHGPYFPAVFGDGKWVYYAPDSTSGGSGSYDATTFIRFNTELPFGTAGSWQQRNVLSKLSVHGVMFDGRWVYFAPNRKNIFYRYDPEEIFTDQTGWETITAGEIGMSELRLFEGVTFDGKYLYYAPKGSTSFVRFPGLPCQGKYGMR